MGKTSLIDIADINLDQENAREHDEANRDAIRKSLDRFGAGRSVVIDSNNTIRAGNGTVEIARDAGFKKVLVVEPEPDTIVAVKRADWSEQEAKGYGVADNRAAELARWNLPGLEVVIASIPDIDIDAIGFGGGQLDALLQSFDAAPAPMPDLDPSDPEHTKISFTLSSAQAATVGEALTRATASGLCPSGKKGEALAAVCEAYLES